MTHISLFLGALVALATALSTTAQAADNRCIHVCSNVCVTKDFASRAKFNCDDTAKAKCYQQFARCVAHEKRGCEWQKSKALDACLKHLPSVQ